MNKFVVSTLIIAAAAATGLYFRFCTKTIDSPIEQVAEQILKENGIDIDFSENKKNQ